MQADVSEQERLARLAGFEIVDTPAERTFDDLAALAAQVCETPMALVCFVAADRQFFKARFGLAIGGSARDTAMCAHAILQRDVFVVPDASSDDRFATGPLVTGTPASDSMRVRRS